MKYRIILSLAMSFMLSCFIATAQAVSADISGIYRTEDDFKNNRLSEVAPVDKDNYIAIALNKLKSYRNGRVTKIPLRDIYGYYQDGVKYRIYRKQTLFDRYARYQVIDESALVVYTCKARGYKRGGYAFYYWSGNNTSPILRITRKNLQEQFSDHPDFVGRVTKQPEFKKLHVTDTLGRTTLNRYYQSMVVNHINL